MSRRRQLQVVVLFVLVLLGSVLPVAAQEPEPGETGRGESGMPPPREPVVVKTERISPHAVRTEVIVAAAEDTYIASNRPDWILGGATRLFLGYSLDQGFGAERILLRFNVGLIPEGAIVNNARLRIYLAESIPAGDSPMGTALHRVTSSWSEGSVTWNTRPAYSGEISASANVGSSPGPYEWDLTGLVQDWVSRRYANDGLIIIGDERVQQRERSFNSRNVQGYPQLIIDYTVDTSPPVVTMEALPQFSPGTFTIRWRGEDQGPSGIASYDVRFREVGRTDWLDLIHALPPQTSASFTGVSGRTYQFEARGTDWAGNREPFAGAAEAWTTVDSTPPNVRVNALPARTKQARFTVRWSGSDNENGSGIQYYDVRYRFNGGPWTNWRSQTVATSAAFDASFGDGVYEFEARGVDNLGNVEPFSNVREAATAVDREAPFIRLRARLPLLLNGARR